MKRRKCLLPIMVLLVCIGAVLWYYKPIGTVEGPEWEILHVDGVTYVREGSYGYDIPFVRKNGLYSISHILYNVSVS